MSPTPLEHRIRALVRLNGPMAVHDYMALCLGDPEHGYYMAREPFGADGDFVTAPEVSQMFGEVIGAAIVEAWERAGRPAPFRLIELGPGRGTLMADLLRVARRVPAFLAAARLGLVETSPRLRARQAATLAGGPLTPTWYERIEEIPAGPLLVIANEFFDALPIRQFQKADGGWHERVVGLDDDGVLAFGLGPTTLPAERRPVFMAGAPEGAIVEVSPAGVAVMATLAERVVRDGGVILAVDYGYAGPAFGDTFQAIRSHTHVDPLGRPGEADLTAHVDFMALAQAAWRTGAAVQGPIEQGDFLLALGLAERAGRLGADKDAATREALVGQVARLVGPEEMGSLFKVLAVGPPGLAMPGFPPPSPRPPVRNPTP
ncbi:class I SAM-dependent methyltransferase [Siculibacillus lacustris]|uniref:Class I SAM-dependent methyltransferase n=1 Tax=Siculibacillus lacustris TaxID=1549641 RepID=A0A4V2KSW8_9HYPH|nr:class I SAM-dependent methyltransferase [Siculibacillus lacustris]TBW34740.1 class I SAM-dependent methyltransferase [Siculibacillus lacustris]